LYTAVRVSGFIYPHENMVSTLLHATLHATSECFAFGSNVIFSFIMWR